MVAVGSRNPDLQLTPEELALLLCEAGFAAVTLLHDEGGMALYRATNPG